MGLVDLERGLEDVLLGMHLRFGARARAWAGEARRRHPRARASRPAGQACSAWPAVPGLKRPACRATSREGQARSLGVPRGARRCDRRATPARSSPRKRHRLSASLLHQQLCMWPAEMRWTPRALRRPRRPSYSGRWSLRWRSSKPACAQETKTHCVAVLRRSPGAEEPPSAGAIFLLCRSRVRIRESAHENYSLLRQTA